LIINKPLFQRPPARQRSECGQQEQSAHKGGTANAQTQPIAGHAKSHCSPPLLLLVRITAANAGV